MGPTASGKSALAIALAREINAEIISADSRQIYRGMDIGTGKEPGTFQWFEEMGGEAFGKETGVYMCEGIVHWMIDIAEPNEDFAVEIFCQRARSILSNLDSRGKNAIVCGGTGFWIQSLVENAQYPRVAPNKELRAILSTISVSELFEKLRSIDPKRALTIDASNPARLIRSIEIASALGAVPELIKRPDGRVWKIFAIEKEKEVLRSNIEKRLQSRLDLGMVEEVKKLHVQGISWEKLDAFGLEYRWISRYLRDLVTFEEMREKLLFDIIHYAKRQIVWIRRWKKSGVPIEFTSEGESLLREARLFLGKEK